MTLAANTVPAARPARRDPALVEVARKVERGERLTAADGALLFATADIHEVCRLADMVRAAGGS